MSTPDADREYSPSQPRDGSCPPCIFLAHCPLSVDALVGREQEYQVLQNAVHDEAVHLVTLLAPEGMGKTALVSHWLRRMITERPADTHGRVECILGWTFSSTGRSETSADEFLAYALSACGDAAPQQGMPWQKGRRLARLLQARRTILVIENLHAVQYHDETMQGRLKDQGLKALFYALSRQNPGLCVLTTAEPLKDLESGPQSHVRVLELPAFSPDIGAHMLKANGVKGPLDAIKHAARSVDGHPLALHLLAGYLTFTHRGDIRKLDLNAPLLQQDRVDTHVRRVVDGFTIWLQRKPELNILFLLGVWGGRIQGQALSAPYHDPALAALLQSPAIKGLTDYLHEASAEEWQQAIDHLIALSLVKDLRVFHDTPSAEIPPDDDLPDHDRAVECHRLVREYFAAQFRTRLPASWRESRQRLYEAALRSAENAENSPARSAMPLLRDAIHYGRALDIDEQLFHDIYWRRIHQGEHPGCAAQPGAELSVLSSFFKANWAVPTDNLSDESFPLLLTSTAARLRDVGRLREASEVVKLCMVFWNSGEHWRNAADQADMLSRLLLPAGDVEQAIIHARLAAQLYEAGEHPIRSAGARIRLLRALHAAGDFHEAEALCHDLEALELDDAPDEAFLLTTCGEAACCDFFLQRGRYDAVQDKVAAHSAAESVEPHPLERAIAHFFHGKSLLGQVRREALEEGETGGARAARLLEARELLDQARHIFEEHGELEWLIRALLGQAAVCRVGVDFPAASTALQEARDSIELAGMALYLTDYHLEAARLIYARHALDDGKFSSDRAGEEEHQQMHDHVEVAEALIWRTGYHVRDAELEELMTLLKDAIPARVEEAAIAHHQEPVNWLAPPRPAPPLRPVPKPAMVPPQPPQPQKPVQKPKPSTQTAVVEVVRGKIRSQAPSPPIAPHRKIQPPGALKPATAPPVTKPARPEQQGPDEQQAVLKVPLKQPRLRTAEGYDTVYLYPGELYIAERPTIVWTLLGSCIAVVFYSERLKMGAICHAQLPEERFRDTQCSVQCEHPCYDGQPDPSRFKYATCSIRYLYDQFRARGIERDEMKVKLFGGASVLESMPDSINVGEENVAVARQVLQEYQVKIVRKDVGGRRGRTLYFYSDTGEVFMKKHRSSEER